jgi:hypothetical protein
MGNDTVNLDYAKMLRGRAIAAKARGNNSVAINYWQRYSNLKDTLNHQLLEGKAHEYAARYRLQEERLNTEREEAAKKRMGIIATLLGIILIGAAIFVYFLEMQLHSIREKNAKGKVIAEFNVTVVTEGRFRRDYSGQWLAVTAPLKYIPSGVTDLCIVADQDAIDVDAVEFKNRIEYYSNATGASSQPDNDGFVRRWNVLEPIPLDINTNILFTDSYLAQTLGDPKVQALIKTVPNDRQQVKYDSKTTLTWHKIESNFYNVKLFRFAEQYGKKIYGVIFPVTTVIECDDDMQGVRLMAGSNSASKWYLNGEEILTMSGDRRMVRDDCASKSITLRKGTNVLSGLIINGPGMSDFCVRFIDKNGNTVKNFKVK